MQSINNNEYVFLPNDIKNKYLLPSNYVLKDHIQSLVEFQDHRNLKLAPRLEQYMLNPNNFQKMRVCTSSRVIHNDVIAGLKFMAEDQEDCEDYETTAWFLEVLFKWYNLMASRSPRTALSLKNELRYNESIDFLEETIQIMKKITIGEGNYWKPVQTGIILSTKSVLDLNRFFLHERNYDFLLTSRFVQDGLENVFCTLRQKQSKPSALQFKQNLRLHCVSQYLNYTKTSSYEEDAREILPGFLEYLSSVSSRNLIAADFPHTILDSEATENILLDNTDYNSLYNVAGYILNGIKNNYVTCDRCFEALESEIPLETFGRLTELKEFKKGALFYPSEFVFTFFIRMEKVFRHYTNVLMMDQSENWFQRLRGILSQIETQFENCHEIKHKIISRFGAFRCRISRIKRNRDGRILQGRSTLSSIS